MASFLFFFLFLLFVGRGTSITAPAFLWSTQDGISDSGVDYRTISRNDLPKLILSQGGWSSLLCPRENLHKPLDIGIVFIARQLQSDQALSNLLKVSFTRSNFSMAFPYVSPSEEDKTMETSLISGFTESCGHDFGVDNIAFLESCSVDGADFPKLADMKAVHGYLTSVLKNKQNRKKHLIVLCSGGSASSEGLDPSWSEGDIFSELINSVEQSGASYSVLYASDPYKSLEYTSYRALDRFLAEGSAGNGSVSSSFCDGVCQIKSSFLEGLLVAIVLLIILISGLCCMMGIDTPTRFEAPQDS